MGYPKELLNENESVLVDRIPHWSFMAGSGTMMVLAFLATIAIAVLQLNLVWIGFICIVVVAFGSLGRFLRWRTTNFVLTTDRLVVRTGIVSKSGLEIPLERITNISYHQTLAERVLRVGDLVVESAGVTGQQRFTDVAKPQELQNLIYRQADLDREHSDATGGNHGGSIPEQIEKLGELRDRGLISNAEFQEKKNNLLNKM